MPLCSNVLMELTILTMFLPEDVAMTSIIITVLMIGAGIVVSAMLLTVVDLLADSN